MRTRLWSGVTIGFAIALAFAGRDAASQRQPGAPNTESGVDLSAMNRGANACDDFYQFACGGWITSHPLPADRATNPRSLRTTCPRRRLRAITTVRPPSRA